MMLLKELIRFSTQHRTLYCYMILSVWIFLLITTVMYKYTGYINNYNNLGYVSGKRVFLSTTIEDENTKFKKYQEQCTPLENITKKDDGGILDGYKLQGVLLVIRHGDRGPVYRVRDIVKVDCGVENGGDILLNRYKSFLINLSNSTETNHMIWNKIGPFHGIPLLPRTENGCYHVQLTYKGISQLLHVGDLLHQVYSRPLGLHLKSPSTKGNINSTLNNFLNSDEVIVFSTSYHRAFQSAMALLHAFLPQDKWLALDIQEVYEMHMCFSDCTCAKSNVLDKQLEKLISDNLSHHSVVPVARFIGLSLLPSSKVINDPRVVLDAVLTLMCHNATLTCKKNVKTEKPVLLKTTTPTIDQQNDVNIGQDKVPVNANNQEQNVVDRKKIDESTIYNMELDDDCIEQSNIHEFMSFINWNTADVTKRPIYKHNGLLKAYGLIQNIASYMLKMTKGDRTKFVLYSGHDRTIEYLTAALGIYMESIYAQYASRLAFEVYRSDAQTDYYFRVIFNGNDVTQQIDFCSGGKSLCVTRDNRGNKANLCPIENIIRFIHDDYFSSFNAKNFKDACKINK